MLAEPVAVDGEGYLRVPAGPGLGFELDEEAVAFHRVGGTEVAV
jgi:L-alanine-DL-glutamate epimerase-like enolase superfamily enzyme